MNNEGIEIKLKHFISLKKGKNPVRFFDSGNFPYLTMDYLRGRDKDIKFVEENDNLIFVQENDILVLWDGANAGEIMLAKAGYLSSTMAKISSKTDKIKNQFLFYLLKNFEAILKDFSGGTTIPHLDSEILLHSSFFIPSLNKQTAIAQFLDDKTAKIEEAIAIKAQQIKLLKERKQILIHQAVTRGLDDSVTLKDSGVEWIGDIPEHWEVSRLGLILTPYSIKNYPNKTLLSITRELGIIKRDLDDLESNHNFIPEDLSGYKLIRTGDFGMNKMKAWQGSYGISKYTGIISPAYYTFKLVETINPDFFHFAIRSNIYVPFFGKASDGVRIGQWDLSKERMKQIPFIIPSLNEQQQILEYIDYIIEKIESAIGLKQQEIEKLKEYNTSLINSCVTGKVKVGGV